MSLYTDILTALREGVDVSTMLDTACERLELERMIADIQAKEAQFIPSLARDIPKHAGKPSPWREGFAARGGWNGAQSLREVARHLTGHDYSTVRGARLNQLSRWLNSDPSFEKVNGKWQCMSMNAN